MLYFSSKPDFAFQEIVRSGLAFVGDALRADCLSDLQAMSIFSDRTCKVFDRADLVAELDRLLAAHTSKELFRLTDYHFLILHDIICETVLVHNECLGGEAKLSFVADLDIKRIDLDELLNIYFWDVDFLLPDDTFAGLTPEGKASLGFSRELFGVVQGLKPHPSGIELKPIAVPEDWVVQNIYKPGEDYPAHPVAKD